MSQSREIRANSAASRIAIFNHKGGVGKTTISINVAAALAKKGYQILLVDADPQCNLTSHLLEASVVDDLLDKSDSDEGATVWSALRPISEATGDVQSIEPFEVSENLFLLPGDIRLAEFEQDLVEFWGECFQRKARGYRGTSALSRAVDFAAGSCGADFVFYDSGPNIGALNRAILLDCDYLVVPAACDLFSLRAIKALGHTLATWINDWQTVSELAPDNAILLTGMPKLAGYVPQRFRVYGGQPTTEFAAFMSKLDRAILVDVVNVLRRIDESLVEPVKKGLKLGEVKDFGGLASASQTQGVPIFSVAAANVWQTSAASISFNELADQLVKRVNQ
ncbi:MAG TPA: AAA family ATPase [Myxococcaceae bacterium]|nr:AAA family ATPase [Myxococcaceae bacterium]